MLIKQLFNSFFSEKTKERVRKQFAPFFSGTDRIIMYLEYKRAVQKILRKTFFSGAAYSYRNNLFLKKIRGEYLKYLLVEDKSVTEDTELSKCFDYIDKNGIDLFCYSDMQVSLFSDCDFVFDEEKQMFYTHYLGKRMYLKRSINSVEKAIKVVNDLAIEQMEQSPHCYLSSSFTVNEKDTLFDIGCAEGNLALSVIELVDRVYLFECDKEWIEALEATFAPWKEKVEIIPLMVSNVDSRLSVTLDSFCEKRHISTIDFVKMDVEGSESLIISGATDLLNSKSIRKWAIAVYHNKEDEKRFTNLLRERGYSVEIP